MPIPRSETIRCPCQYDPARHMRILLRGRIRDANPLLRIILDAPLLITADRSGLPVDLPPILRARDHCYTTSWDTSELDSHGAGQN